MSSESSSPESRLPFPDDASATEAPAYLEKRVIERLRERRLIESAAPRKGVLLRLGWVASVAAAFLFGWAMRAPAAVPGANYMLLLDDDPGRELTADVLAQRIDEYSEWAGGLAERGMLVAGERLLPRPTSFGPAQSVARVSGFFLLRAGDEEEAQSVARDCPHLRHGGSVVLQPIDEEASGNSE